MKEGTPEAHAKERGAGTNPVWQDYPEQALALRHIEKQDAFSHSHPEPFNEDWNNHVELPGAAVVRTFKSGANRDTDDGKWDPEGFLDPLVLRAFFAYMHKNRHLKDGSLRDSDNWQKGMPRPVIMKSMWRHFFDVWSLHRGYEVTRPEDGSKVDMEEALCGLLFNVAIMLREYLLGREVPDAA